MDLRFTHEKNDSIVKGVLEGNAIRLSLEFEGQKHGKVLEYPELVREVQGAQVAIVDVFEIMADKENILVAREDKIVIVENIKAVVKGKEVVERDLLIRFEDDR